MACPEESSDSTEPRKEPEVIVNAHSSALRATKIFRTFEEGDPDLIDLGLAPVQAAIGGMFPGNLVGIACGQNVGKSSLLLAMALNTHEKIGIVELEDGPDVWGARILAAHTDIPPTRIRKKELTSEETRKIAEVLDGPVRGPLIEYEIGGGVDKVQASAKRLIEAGCRVVALNYLQKCRGSSAERRVEVGNTMSSFLQACAPKAELDFAGAVPVIVSQLVRLDPSKEPFPSHMKESGDIEAECRLIIMGWRDPSDPLLLRCKVAKSSFGGGGLRFCYRYTKAEYLVHETEDNDPEQEEF
jgi:replicative DNA helicase